jgi:DNA helicase-2/ATP-dependent DNA helicase PcrA
MTSPPTTTKPQEPLLTLNGEQAAAAHYAGGARHLLVLAGAGTGKTRTLIARVLYLLQHQVPARRILLLTFTRRAAKEMLHRLESHLHQEVEQITAGTFHHFCLQVMRRVPVTFGVGQSTIIDRDDANSLIQLIRGEHVKKNAKKDFPRSSTLLNYLSYARNCCRPLSDYLLHFTEHDAATIEVIQTIADQYEQRKRQRHYLDYDDILHRFITTLDENAELREKVAGLYQHILVDEMQDTNPLQWRILSALSKANLFCVGDDAQSIYAFRGADFRNVHEFRERLDDAAVLKLQENYRSGQEILDLANWLLAQSSLHYDKHLTAARGTGIKPLLVDFDSRFDEALWIARDLIRRHEGGARWADHMVLVRSAWSAKTLEGALIDQEIPYRFVGGTSLLEAAHVKDILAQCRAALSRTDELAWVRYLKCWPKIGDATAARLMEQLIHTDPAEPADEVLLRLLPKRPEIAAGLRAVRELRHLPGQAIRKATELASTTFCHRYDRWDSRMADLRLLADLASRYQDLFGFVETYTLDPISNSEAEQVDQDDLVTLITVHSAKGTEAPVCYCLGVQPGLYPHQRSLGDAQAEEEERRVLYVAFTRAQDELIITRSGGDNSTVFHNGSWVGGVNNRYFLEYLPPKLVTHQQFGYGLGYGSGSALDDLADFE